MFVRLILILSALLTQSFAESIISIDGTVTYQCPNQATADVAYMTTCE